MSYYDDFELNQGADWALTLELANKDGSTKDLTNHTVQAMLKRGYDADSDNTHLFSSIISNPATDGKVTLSLTNQQTDALSPRHRYLFDVELAHVDSDSNVIIERILEGKITVNPSVTR